MSSSTTAAVTSSGDISTLAPSSPASSSGTAARPSAERALAAGRHSSQRAAGHRLHRRDACAQRLAGRAARARGRVAQLAAAGCARAASPARGCAATGSSVGAASSAADVRPRRCASTAFSSAIQPAGLGVTVARQLPQPVARIASSGAVGAPERELDQRVEAGVPHGRRGRRLLPAPAPAASRPPEDRSARRPWPASSRPSGVGCRSAAVGAATPSSTSVGHQRRAHLADLGDQAADVVPGARRRAAGPWRRGTAGASAAPLRRCAAPRRPAAASSWCRSACAPTCRGGSTSPIGGAHDQRAARRAPRSRSTSGPSSARAIASSAPPTAASTRQGLAGALR